MSFVEEGERTIGEARAPLTGALEDYIETIFLLARDHGFARVRDIARARKVKSSSVSPALRRLAELGLVTYVQREYVGLTDSGKQAARRVLSRHDLLARFFSEVLQMSPATADQEACAMEHSLSPDAMDRLVRFFEFLGVCPDVRAGWLEKFHRCAAVQEGVAVCDHVCPRTARIEVPGGSVSVSDLKPGQQGKVRQVHAKGAVRQRLLDMGLLPEVVVRFERVAPTGDPIWISLQGSQIALRRSEAESVLVSAV